MTDPTLVRSDGEEWEGYDPCPCCGHAYSPPYREHMGTAYANEESNWLLACAACQEDAATYWSDMWAEYNNSRL